MPQPSAAWRTTGRVRAMPEHAWSVSRPARRRLAEATAQLRSGPWTADAVALTVMVALLVVVGLVMSFSASFVQAAESGDPFEIARRQLLWAAIGSVAFGVIAATNHRIWRTVSWLLLVVGLGGLILVLVPGLGLSHGGSSRWLAVGPLQVQPSQLAQLATITWLADIQTRKRELGLDVDAQLSYRLVPALPLLGLEAALILAEPDLGTALLLGLIVLLVLWADGLRLTVMAGLVMVGGLMTAVATVVAPYRMARVSGWLNPDADPLGHGYQLLQSLYALGSGGWFGVGLGASRAKWNYVPNPATDFIYAVIGEELGLVGALVVLLLFVGMVVIGLRVASRAPDRFGRLCATAVAGWITGQALLNASAVTGLLPITGVTLPLVSVGGSSLVVSLLALGLLVSIARATTDGSGGHEAVVDRTSRFRLMSGGARW